MRLGTYMEGLFMTLKLCYPELQLCKFEDIYTSAVKYNIYSERIYIDVTRFRKPSGYYSYVVSARYPDRGREFGYNQCNSYVYKLYLVIAQLNRICEVMYNAS